MSVRFSPHNRFKSLGASVVLGAVLFLLMAGPAFAQVNCINSYLDCSEVPESQEHSVSLISAYGEIGDTVWVEVLVSVPNDTMSGFITLIRYHEAYLTPVRASEVPEDSLWTVFELMGSLAQLQDEHPGDQLFFSTISSAPFDSGAIVAAFLPQFPDSSTQLEFVDEALFRLPFLVSGTAPLNGSAAFWFQESNEYVLIDSATQEYFCADCRRTSLSIDRGSLATVSYPTLVENCCMGAMRGNIDMDPDDEITIADLISLVERMFQGGPDLPCLVEADVNGSGNADPDIADLIHLVAYMFQEGPPPAPCP